MTSLRLRKNKWKVMGSGRRGKELIEGFEFLKKPKHFL